MEKETLQHAVHPYLRDGGNRLGKREERPFKGNEKIKPNMVLQDNVGGFEYPQFWGDYNLIEPEASIELVIKKNSKTIGYRRGLGKKYSGLPSRGDYKHFAIATARVF